MQSFINLTATHRMDSLETLALLVVIKSWLGCWKGEILLESPIHVPLVPWNMTSLGDTSFEAKSKPLSHMNCPPPHA